jgi:hypothetical protein
MLCISYSNAEVGEFIIRVDDLKSFNEAKILSEYRMSPTNLEHFISAEERSKLPVVGKERMA